MCMDYIQMVAVVHNNLLYYTKFIISVNTSLIEKFCVYFNQIVLLLPTTFFFM